MNNKLTTEELYLDKAANSVIETNEIKDVNAGMYPCYYLRSDGNLKISTSVISLIEESGEFSYNSSFKPPNFIDISSGKESPSTGPFINIVGRFINMLPEEIQRRVRLKHELSKEHRRPWYTTWETVDHRITKLRPFECVTGTEAERGFTPTFSINTTEKLIKLTAETLSEYIKRIENSYPNRQHIVMAGGKDSLLILLIKKESPENWHVFSSEPNCSLVEDFLTTNEIQYGNLYQGTDDLQENKEETIMKIIQSDLYVDPAHIRFINQLSIVKNEIEDDCIFWMGSEGDTFYSWNRDYQLQGRQGYFDYHMTRSPSFVGSVHQTYKNVLDAPILSAYHGYEMWNNIFRHYDPDLISEGDDLRDEIARQLHGRAVKWPSRNPGPSKYDYDLDIDPYEEYINHIAKVV
jgi:hypothetical protein